MKSKKKKDNLDFVYENIGLQAGVIGGTHLVGKLSQSIPSRQSSNIMRGMETLRVIPTVHAMGGIFSQLQSLEKKAKHKR